MAVDVVLLGARVDVAKVEPEGVFIDLKASNVLVDCEPNQDRVTEEEHDFIILILIKLVLKERDVVARRRSVNSDDVAKNEVVNNFLDFFY